MFIQSRSNSVSHAVLLLPSGAGRIHHEEVHTPIHLIILTNPSFAGNPPLLARLHVYLAFLIVHARKARIIFVQGTKRQRSLRIHFSLRAHSPLPHVVRGNRRRGRARVLALIRFISRAITITATGITISAAAICAAIRIRTTTSTTTSTTTTSRRSRGVSYERGGFVLQQQAQRLPQDRAHQRAVSRGVRDREAVEGLRLQDGHHVTDGCYRVQRSRGVAELGHDVAGGELRPVGAERRTAQFHLHSKGGGKEWWSKTTR